MDPCISFIFFSFYFVFHVETFENLDTAIKDYAYETKETSEDPMKIHGYNQYNKHGSSLEHSFNPLEKLSFQDFPGLQGESSDEDNNLFLSPNSNKEAAVNILPAIKETSDDSEMFHMTPSLVSELKISDPNLEYSSSTSPHHNVNVKRTTPSVPYLYNKNLRNLNNLSESMDSIKESLVSHVTENDKNFTSNSSNKLFNNKNDLDNVYKKDKSLHNLDGNISYTFNKSNHEPDFNNSFNPITSIVHGKSEIKFNETEKNFKNTFSRKPSFNKDVSNFFSTFIDLFKSKSNASHTHVDTNNHSVSYSDNYSRQLSLPNENDTVIAKTSVESIQNEIITSTFTPEIKPNFTSTNTPPNFDFFQIYEFKPFTLIDSNNSRDEYVLGNHSMSNTNDFSLVNETLNAMISSENTTENNSSFNEMTTSETVSSLTFSNFIKTTTVPPFSQPLEEMHQSSSFTPTPISFLNELENASDEVSLRENKINESLIEIDNELSKVYQNVTSDGSLNISTKFGETKFITDALNTSTTTSEHHSNFINRTTVSIENVSPKFENAPYKTLLLKDASDNSVIFKEINVTTTSSQKISIVCSPYEQFPNVCEYFTVITSSVRDGMFSGSLVLKNSSLPSSESIYQVKLTAIGENSNSSTTITVIVQSNLVKELNETLKTFQENSPNDDDMQETKHTPNFNLENITVSIPENFLPGALIPDIYLNFTNKKWDDIIFNLTTLDPSGQFIVEPAVVNQNTSISIRLHPKASLDFEIPTQREFVFLIAAIEQKTELALSAMVAFTVEISDINDNVPKFSDDIYNVSVSELVPVGSVLLYVNATDKDSGMFGTEGIRFTLEGSNAEKFRIDSESGTLIVAPCHERNGSNCLDYEEDPLLILNIRATDDRGMGNSGVAVLVVNLIDSNDNPPKFEQSEYNGTIKLKAKEFTSPLFVKAIDTDVSSVIKYSILSNGIEDFYINSTTGQILINESSWLEKNDADNVIRLLIKAYDGDNFDTTTVLITVLTENNYVPQFLFPYYNATIPDSSPPGTFVSQVSAFDNDSLPDTQIKYHIEYGGHKDFVIDELTGIVSVASTAHLEYDEHQEYHLRIIASDNGVPVRTGSTHLTINITDGNNKPPTVHPLLQILYIKEDIPQGEIIYAVHAEDHDAVSKSSLSYRIQKSLKIFDKNGLMLSSPSSELMELFEIDPSSGEIRVTSTVSRDKAALFSLVVLAVDTSANPLQTGSGTLLINILDGEPFQPVFPPPWSEKEPYLRVNVTEEIPVGTLLLSLSSPYSISNPQRYVINPDNPYVEVNLTSGIVSVKSRIDYEQIQSFSFTVNTYIENQTTSVLDVVITVDVLNINDNDPVFSLSDYHFIVEENSPPGTLIGTISVNDNDLGDFGQVKLSLDGNHVNYFTISEDGKLMCSINDVLDREINDHLSFKIIAVDQDPNLFKRRTAVSSVYITVTDVNDNAPKFINKHIEEEISPTMAIGSPITQVIAIDKDLGINGSLKYSFASGNEEGIFGIVDTSGVIYLKNKPSRNSSIYTLLVVCYDQEGEGSFKDEAIVILTVTKMNIHPPVFILPDQSDFYVQENDPNTIILTIVKAKDLDSSHINYSFYKNGRYIDEVENFVLNSVTGELLVKGPLDRETTEKYTLLITAKDDGHPHSLESVRLINVFVIDVDDNVPTFPDDPYSQPYSFSINENEPTKSLVGQVKAIDPDTGVNGQIFYYITGGNDDEAFIIDMENGIIRTNSILDYEKKSNYILQVEASNKKHLSAKFRERRRLNLNPLVNDSNTNPSSTSVQIRIHNVDDNVPVFVGLPYQTGVQYSAKRGEFVTQVKAIDPDGDNITYSLLSSHLYRSKASSSAGAVVPQPFTIDQSGRIYTAGLLSSYNQDRFLLTVVAKENVPPHHESKAVVEVWIYEVSELIRVVIALPPDEVTKNLPSYIEILSNITRGSVYVDDIRYHVTKQKEIDSEGTDMYIHVVDSDAHIIQSAGSVLDVADSITFFIPEYQHLRLTSIESVSAPLKEEAFNPALAALIAVLVVMFIGLVIIIFICCANNYWIDYKKVVSVNDQPISTISVPSQLLSTYNPSFSSYRENPLWIEHRKIKAPYEEQELSMHVFSDLMNRSQARAGARTENISYSSNYPEQNRRQSTVIEANLNLDDDYATLDESNDVNDYPMKKESKANSPALSKQIGSSVVLTPSANNDPHPQLSFNKNGEPVMIGELM